MKNDFTLAMAVAGFVSAIFISSFVKLGFTFFLFLIFLAIILFVYSSFFIINVENKKHILLLVIFIFSFSLGILRYEIKDTNSADIILENNLGNKVVVNAVVADEPARKESQQVLIVNFKEIISGSSTISVSGKGIVSTDVYPEFKYGDEIKISGKLEKPENFQSSSTQAFDYISYLAKDDIFYKMDFAKASFISSGHGNQIKSSLFSIKNAFMKNINKVIGEPESSLLGGILLGTKSSIDKMTTETFRKAGLSHIIALSGYNITVVADAIMKLLTFLPKTFSFSAGVLGIILFIIMSGASSTAVRAGVMALIVILAQITRRNYQAGRALIIAGLLMVIINPKILVFDISFQLSFLATIAIIYVAPIIKNKFSFITEKFGLRDVISSTISAQIMVLPLILYKMGLLSLVALPANILVLAFIPATMFFGFMTGTLGYISNILSLPFAWISWALLAYIIKVSEFFASLPFSSVSINWFSQIIMVVCYIFIAIWILLERKNKTHEIKQN